MKELWSHQVYACTASPNKAKSFGVLEDNIFKIWNWVSGRFSIWSSIGLPLAIAIGRENFLSFLEGGAELDEHFRTAPLEKNLPISLALISYWRRNVLGYNNYALIPYSYALRRFYLHIQQIEMESNGKVSRRNTSPVVWGGCGTDSQHSFFQHFHQSEDITPVDFILFSNPDDKSFSQSHSSLIANCLAQSHSLMAGAKSKLGDEESHCGGDKPSTTLVIDSLSPKSLGKLISLYENKVIALSQIWEINPFDQPSVELGKRISKSIEQHFQNDIGAPLNVDSSTTALLSIIKQHQISTDK